MGHDSYSLIVYDSSYMTHIYVGHYSHIYESDHMWHNSYIYGTWLIHLWWDHMWHGTLFMGHDSYSLMVYDHYTWLIYMWGITHIYIGHDSYIYESDFMWRDTSFVGPDAFRLMYVTRLTWCIISGTWLIKRHGPWLILLSHIYMGHDSYIYESNHMWRNSYIYGTWCIHLWWDHMWRGTLFMGHDSYSLMVYDSSYMTHMYMGHDSYIYESNHMWHDSYIYGTWHIHLWWDHKWRGTLYMGHDSYRLVQYDFFYMTHYVTYEWVISHVWRGHVTLVNLSCHAHEWVMSHIWVCHVTHMNESWHTYECVMSHVWMSHVTRMKESCHTYE